MFAQYDYKFFPYVIVRFSKITSHNDFDLFLSKWMNLYSKKKSFIFIFDTSNMSMISIKHCFMMASFIKQLKKQPIHYLQKSYIIVNNLFIEKLVTMLFYLQRPVADVFIIRNSIDILKKYITQNKIIERQVEIVDHITPGTSIIPFL